ncbi:small nucleolar RNP protein [Trichosporon asahii var. asahii CBS 8904]|uniref:H/ACA ribonucleoprotein complex subunit n=1 Tax=Trichosporon asahii var. asahii (strain CBS 8904) TaxID=1220162 RepID=K1VMI9_TRIAC|nr:small nucleolar RNP protein [Trichosporon asahii var. asahii CBS 8904]
MRFFVCEEITATPPARRRSQRPLEATPASTHIRPLLPTTTINMSGRGGFSRGGGGGRGGFRGGRGGGRGGFTQGPPDTVLEVGSFQHPVESEMLCSLTMPEKVPYFNAPIYLSNKTQIGKVDEILGPINEVFFTVKMEAGMNADSFKKDDKVYIGGDKLLPLDRFLPKPKVAGPKSTRPAAPRDIHYGTIYIWFCHMKE